MRGAFKSAAPVLDGEQCVLDKNCSSCQTPSSKFLELFAQFQVLQALGSSSNPPKVPPAAPRIPPGLPEILLKFALGHPSVELVRLLAHFLPSPKLIKIWHRPKASQNLKNRAPRCFQAWFSNNWDTILASIFNDFFEFAIISASHGNAFIQRISVGLSPSGTHFFGKQFHQILMLFLMPHSGCHLFVN